MLGSSVSLALFPRFFCFSVTAGPEPWIAVELHFFSSRESCLGNFPFPGLAGGFPFSGAYFEVPPFSIPAATISSNNTIVTPATLPGVVAGWPPPSLFIFSFFLIFLH